MNKTVKKILAITAVALIAMPLFYSCKKGEEDPFISLRSRDKRITGEWKLTSASTNDTRTFINNPGDNPTTITTTETYDGTLWTETTVFDTFPPNTQTDTISITFYLCKDGTASYTKVDAGDKHVLSGSWQWLDSKKNKTHILVPLPLGTCGGTFEVLELKNKELKLTYSDSHNDTDSDGTYDNQSCEETYTFEKTDTKLKDLCP